MANLFNISLWLVGPSVVHFHLFFPSRTMPGRRARIAYWSYLIALIGAGPYILNNWKRLSSFSWFENLQFASLVFLGINLIAATAILIYNYRHVRSALDRGKIRIVILGGIIGTIPVVSLTILPAAFFDQPIIPFEFAFLLVGIIPVTYGYAIVRHQLIEIEKHVNRGATQVLVYSLLGGLYVLMTSLLEMIHLQSTVQQWILNTLVVLLLASVFSPLRQQVQMFVDRVFYGGWYDMRTAITNITQNLDTFSELRPLAQALCGRTAQFLFLENIFLFITGPKGDLSVYETHGQREHVDQLAASFPILPAHSPILRFLKERKTAIESGKLKSSLPPDELSDADLELLNCSAIRLWVPFFGREKIGGLLALGPKIGGDVFTVDDFYILGVVSRQVGPIIENIHLLTQLRRHAKELERRVDERTTELYDAKERVEAILASVGDGVVVTDLDGRIITVNKAIEAQFSYRSEEIAGQELFSLYKGENAPELLESMLFTLRNGEVWSGEMVLPHADGRHLDVQLTMAPVRDQHGRMVGFVGSQRDITQQRELERMKEKFISDVSHELRTPVATLALYVGFLERNDSPERAQYLDIVRSETRRLTLLLEDILDLTRIEGSKTYRVEPVSLNAVTEQVVAANRLLANTSGLELTFEPAENLPSLLGDENLIARVVTNLVSNSIRYTPSGHVCVKTLRLNGRVALQVQDTGMGINREDLPHIFDRFYRGQSVSQTNISGTGLGLAIVKEIVEIHHGEVHVESDPDQGSTFTVTFPPQDEIAWPEKLS